MYPEDYHKKSRVTFRSIFFSFLAGMLVVAGAWLAFNNAQFFHSNTAASDSPFVGSDSGSQSDGKQTSTNTEAAFSPLPVQQGNIIADIVDRVGPAVVKINAVVKSSDNTLNPLFSDPFFRQFFGDAVPNQPQESRALGSGFIVSKDGYILTNEHVVDNATSVKVTVTGYDKPFNAKVVGSDYDLDLAVLKIDAPKDLPTVKMADSNQVRVGDWSIAIGAPYDLDHTVTVGVISAKGRPIDIGDRHYKNLLQTDTSINPGNSGGPLLNLNGEVIGINTAINAEAQGIGFAIPTSTVQEVYEQLKDKGQVIRPWLGVQIQDVTPTIADYFHLKNTDGAIISMVVGGSPADKAGLQQGDVILKYNDTQIKNAQDLSDQVAKSKVGDKVVLLVARGGGQQYVTVTIDAKNSAQ
jgi:Do/DeqQ family serine protease